MIARVLLLLVLLASTRARADDKVALLPLDAAAKLEVYGQVVASEIAQALIAGKIDVVVVLPKMAVPDETKLIIDGKISAGKGGAIELWIRVRDPKAVGMVKDFPATASSLETLEKTTKDLAAKVLPVLRDKLDQLAKLEQAKKAGETIKPPTPTQPPVPKLAPTRQLLVGIMSKTSSTDAEKFRAALVDRVPGWVTSAQRVPSVIEAGMLDAKAAHKTVAASTADRAIAFEVLDYSLWGDTVPMGKARVRVRIADAGQVLFERVVVTDTIVGDKGMSTDAFAARVAGEVLSILRPHVRKVVPAWP
ncbi:MAG: hypothetical protein M4D80_40365 [Myxococcota bacterium]|nr:hypothetical protein [Myxococcota bacterium]